MIASLRGIVQQADEGGVVVEVGGVGVRVAMPASAVAQLPGVGEGCFLYTRLIVREDSLALYGFLDPEPLEVFDMLLQVNGVGPRLGLSVLSHLSAEGLRSAVARQDSGAFGGIPGIGRKTAEKILFHLKDRLGTVGPTRRAAREAHGDVLAALTSLGYSYVEALAAVQALPSDVSESVEERVRLALQYFARP
ncbi:MAG TPA: Holliday junction branch migration protein RuvA [Anaerolineales bacterium]